MEVLLEEIKALQVRHVGDVAPSRSLPRAGPRYHLEEEDAQRPDVVEVRDV